MAAKLVSALNQRRQIAASAAVAVTSKIGSESVTAGGEEIRNQSEKWRENNENRKRDQRKQAAWAASAMAKQNKLCGGIT